MENSELLKALENASAETRQKIVDVLLADKKPKPKVYYKVTWSEINQPIDEINFQDRDKANRDFNAKKNTSTTVYVRLTKCLDVLTFNNFGGYAEYLINIKPPQKLG